MLIKEYRIPMPLSVEEYRIAQLYMIQKKSREESKGEGNGIEIIENKPYMDGPGGSGQFTQKVYHISQHIPSWMVSILPRNALVVYEEAWNAYPYTKTRYTCPFVDKFSIEIETQYYSDLGNQENVFALSNSELNNRRVDFLDIVTEQPGEMKNNEDLKIYKSVKTGRGPLSNDWLKSMKNSPSPVMCAYKLCKVEFKYWGMQSKIERFIHDVALRKTMLKAHCQVWCWQDEWFGLNITDIRRLEEETKKALAEKFGAQTDSPAASSQELGNGNISENIESAANDAQEKLLEPHSDSQQKLFVRHNSQTSMWSTKSTSTLQDENSHRFHTPIKYSMQSIEQISFDTSGDEEFYDANESFQDDNWDNLTKWNSLENISEDKKNITEDDQKQITEETHEANVNNKVESNEGKIEILFLVIHAGIPSDNTQDFSHSSGQAEVNTLAASFNAVLKAHYKMYLGRIAFRLVSCPSTSLETYNLLKNLAPSGKGVTDQGLSGQLLSLFITSSHYYHDILSQTTNMCNAVYQQFLQSDEGKGFDGQVCIIGDNIGSLLAYDIISSVPPVNSPVRSRNPSIIKAQHSETDLPSTKASDAGDRYRRFNSIDESLNCNDAPLRKLSSSSDTQRIQKNYLFSNSSFGSTERSFDSGFYKLDFEVTDFFTLGSPLGVVLAFRSSHSSMDSIPRPHCQHVYNLFYIVDKTSCRMEPLIDSRFAHLPPVDVPRFIKYPYGDGRSNTINDAVTANSDLFATSEPGLVSRRFSEFSISSFSSSDVQLQSLNHVVSSWWGDKRLDYVLYCPEALSSFPSISLPHVFHGSFWESIDLASFILQQVLHPEDISVNIEGCNVLPPFSLVFPREKWQRRRTAVKIRNMTPNHRAKDAVAVENEEQVLSAKFTYGPLDMVYLSGEMVDIYVNSMMQSCDWTLLGTQATDSHGKISFTIPNNKVLPLGIYPLKMVVRGDLTWSDSYIAVIPRNTECVVFSIDGSFAASVSIMGSDPKVQPGSVDVVRHWQDMGYMIVYVTARPDMQKHRVVTWLAQHNFPHGLVWFGDGLTKDPLKQKTNWLRHLQTEYKMMFTAGYGSAKDITVYSHLGLPPSNIFIIGKSTKKLANSCQFLSDGYSAHLADLKSNEVHVIPANHNLQVVKSKGSFTLPRQYKSMKQRKNTIKK